MKQMIRLKITYCFDYLISDLRLLKSINKIIIIIKDSKSDKRSVS